MQNITQELQTYEVTYAFNELKETLITALVNTLVIHLLTIEIYILIRI